MTDTTTTAESGYSTDPQEGPQTPPDGTLEHLDPNNLRLVDNVREYANLNKPFLGSIAERTNCSFASPASLRGLLSCDDASCLTRCHRGFVSNSCHFFRTPLSVQLATYPRA
jgi:hypothetical protein